jgi:hypothetical protein
MLVTKLDFMKEWCGLTVKASGCQLFDCQFKPYLLVVWPGMLFLNQWYNTSIPI